MEACAQARDRATSRSRELQPPIGSLKPARAASNSGRATPALHSMPPRAPALSTPIRKWLCRDRLISTTSSARCMAEDQPSASRLGPATYEFIDTQVVNATGSRWLGWVAQRKQFHQQVRSSGEASEFCYQTAMT